MKTRGLSYVTVHLPYIWIVEKWPGILGHRNGWCIGWGLWRHDLRRSHLQVWRNFLLSDLFYALNGQLEGLNVMGKEEVGRKTEIRSGMNLSIYLPFETQSADYNLLAYGPYCGPRGSRSKPHGWPAPDLRDPVAASCCVDIKHNHIFIFSISLDQSCSWFPYIYLRPSSHKTRSQPNMFGTLFFEDNNLYYEPSGNDRF